MEKKNMDTLKIIGIAVGGVAVVATGVVLAVKFLNKKKKEKQKQAYLSNIDEETLESLIPNAQNKKCSCGSDCTCQKVEEVVQPLES